MNPNDPRGRIALRLRELVSESSIRSSEDLKRKTNYAGSTLSEAMGGGKPQNRNTITAIVKACIADEERANLEIEELVAILGEVPDDLGSEDSQIIELTHKPDTRADSPSEGGSVEKPLDSDDVEEPLGSDDVEKPLDADDLEKPLDADDVEEPLDVEVERRRGSGFPTPPPASSLPWWRAVWSGSADRPGQRRRRRWLTAAALAVVALLVAVVVVTLTGPTYITDGSDNVTGDPEFATIMNKIKAENDRVINAPDHLPVVSVAYAAPFPTERTALSGQLLRELEGAYVMVLQRNEAGGPNPLGGPPRVQLLVANLGDQAADEATVVDQLQDRAAPGAATPLVAVIGLDQSLPMVREAVRGLGVAGVPMVAARLVGDDFAESAVADGFYAVAPPVRDQVAAIARFLGGQARKPLLVEDTTTTDLYGRNIADQFEAQFAVASAGTPLPPPVPFNSSLPGLQTAFAQVLPAICQLQPDVVFFAGRGANLPDFIRQLNTRVCPQVPVTVVTLSDGRQLADELSAENASGSNVEHQLNETMLGAPGRAGVRVVLSAQAIPGVWADQRLVPPPSRTVLSGPFATAFPQQGFPGQRLVDDSGDVIMGHDAMQVVVEAIARSRPPQSQEPITAGLVRQALSSITPYVPVLGASGPISYNEAGYPIEKNIPITEIDPYGRIYALSLTTPS